MPRPGYDCMDAGGRAMQEQLPSDSETRHLATVVSLRYRSCIALSPG